MTKETDAPKGRVLIVAGSDSGGGAGIQADIKAVTMLGGYAMTAITAITAQDTTGVHGVWPVALDAVQGQMRACLSDIGADAVKTGMLGSAELVELVAETLDEQAKAVPTVIDPVMVATSGDRLVDQKAVSAIASLLIPGAGLVTPNAPEAEVLTGKAVDGINGQRRAAEALLEQGAKAALVKGGHIPGSPIIDVLQSQKGEWIFEGERIETRSTHGTGCTLASATAALIAQDLPLPEAVEKAREYLFGAIKNAPDLGKGHGPVAHNWLLSKES
ncbi:bifunctional hydroxymethylpyrimidine kinase/phosphomethylpyrimidine kinase [Hyphomonas sp. FCG-A18]|uniref:bifunctional hydroxymethylpyrimidine kinase/phosphomethylpyrimidine kinase n=1 Tax=Hyphomonas sp. FCG-A18 TaxID=3080019 RepID=UPI002B2E0FD8|nr:bifunctional hydroxymethylpyrimidine kinase/phosphomethylpyrimidine kinase [Hyphomonas sp. FCG-A18]